MRKTKQTFNDADVIFREGDSSDTAYEIVSGQVEIAKTGDDGTVQLAVLNPGEMFGEMGVLDHSKRSATAKAVGEVTVNAISRKDFLTGIRDKPDMALDVMSNLTGRLRGAGDRLAGGGDPLEDDAKPEHLPRTDSPEGAQDAPADEGILSRLFGWKFLPKTERVQILVAPLMGEDGDKHAKHVVQALGRRKGLRAKGIRKPLKIDPDAGPEDQAQAAEAAGRKALAEAQADMMIWGSVPSPGMTIHLKFISFATWSQDTPGSFGPYAVLALPADFGS